MQGLGSLAIFLFIVRSLVLVEKDVLRSSVAFQRFGSASLTVWVVGAYKQICLCQ